MDNIPEVTEKSLNKVSSSYLLWFACFFQLYGLHRIHNGKIRTGILPLCTFGLFGVGQFVDLFMLPNMVDDYNIKLKARMGISGAGVSLWQPAIANTIIKPTCEQLMVKLLKAAEARGGKLSVTQAVMDTEISFAEVEAILKEMLKKGYVGVDNHPDTGVVIYHFLEL